MVGLASLFSDPDFAEGKNHFLIAMGRGLSDVQSVGPTLTKCLMHWIAGTTGSGKSVAIHTLITSLLYIETVRKPYGFIFVDPKELN